MQVAQLWYQFLPMLRNESPLTLSQLIHIISVERGDFKKKAIEPDKAGIKLNNDNNNNISALNCC